jgi:hypothetical protein
MAKFRKKPVVIDAIPCWQAINNFKNDFYANPTWLIDAYEKGDIIATDKGILFSTTTGWLTADRDSFLFLDTDGQLYRHKGDEFLKHHEQVVEGI